MTTTVWALCATVAAAQGLFLCLILFLKKENRLPNRLLGLLLLLLAITLSEWALWWTGLIQQVKWMMAISAAFPWLFGPVLFLFFEATFEYKPLKFNLLRHFLPFVATVFTMLPFYFRLVPDVAAALHWIPPVMGRPWFPVLLFTQMVAYGIWIPWRFRKHFLENDELKRWLRWLLLGYWGIVLTYLIYRLMPWLGLTAPEWKYTIAGSLTVFIYLVAWLGYIEPRVFDGMRLREAILPVKYRKSVLGPESSAALFERISGLMEQEQLFLDSSLSLDMLAKRLHTQRHHVSQAINEQVGKNFSTFVTEYRIRAAQRLLAEKNKRQMNAIEVAYAVGFGTKNAFNLAFKKHTGMTPSDFRATKGEKG